MTFSLTSKFLRTTFKMCIPQNCTYLLCTIRRFAYLYNSQIKPSLKELLPFLTEYFIKKAKQIVNGNVRFLIIIIMNNRISLWRNDWTRFQGVISQFVRIRLLIHFEWELQSILFERWHNVGNTTVCVKTTFNLKVYCLPHLYFFHSQNYCYFPYWPS